MDYSALYAGSGVKSPELVLGPTYTPLRAMFKGIAHREQPDVVKDVKSLIESCDITISAAGSTMYEICACGVPMVTYSLADNQNPGTEAFEKQSLAAGCRS